MQECCRQEDLSKPIQDLSGGEGRAGLQHSSEGSSGSGQFRNTSPRSFGNVCAAAELIQDQVVRTAPVFDAHASFYDLLSACLACIAGNDLGASPAEGKPLLFGFNDRFKAGDK